MKALTRTSPPTKPDSQTIKDSSSFSAAQLFLDFRSNRFLATGFYGFIPPGRETGAGDGQRYTLELSLGSFFIEMNR